MPERRQLLRTVGTCFAIALVVPYGLVDAGYKDMTNPGVPDGIPEDADCVLRNLAWEYGKSLMPARGDFRTLFEALQLHACGKPTPNDTDTWKPPNAAPLDDATPTWFVDAALGSDSDGSGSASEPYRSIQRAVDASRALQGEPRQVVLRAGTHHTSTVVLTPQDNGLTVRGHPGEEAVVSGAVPLGIPPEAWKRHSTVKAGDTVREVMVASLSGQAGLDVIPGLRVGGARGILARYPNGNPEQSGTWFQSGDAYMGKGQYTQGWIDKGMDNQTWLPPRPTQPAEEIVVTAKDWPGVDWPMREDGGSKWTGEGAWGEFHIGSGGHCRDLEPPAGYWCANRPPRSAQERCFGCGKTQTHMSPSGLRVTAEMLPNLPHYTDPRGALISAWRGGGRWYTWQFEVNGWDRSSGVMTFSPRSGMQGGEGMTWANEWYIENVLEELDSPMEYFYDAEHRKLYFMFNATDASGAPLGASEFSATRSKVLFHMKGTKEDPVRDVSILDLVLRDAAGTGLDAHGMPSGGDWAIVRSGAVLLEGTERARVKGNHITRVDGNGVFLSGYNRNATIAENEFSWIGNSAMAAWGDTSECLNADCTRTVPWKIGPDGRGGEQPLGTRVLSNLVREIGIWQKQSSMWFQAVSAMTEVRGNVHFNGPRAGLNWNDGFGGGDEITGNLILNCVRESGDHGPFNSWDRVPYITTLRAGKPSIVPEWKHIHHNFILGTYSTQAAIDNDDGSAYYKTHDNVLVYASEGLKADFGGHDNWHYGNLYAFASKCFQTGNNLRFFNNTCILFKEKENDGYRSTCKLGYGMKVHHNSVMTRSGKLKACNRDWRKWQKAGHDKYSSVRAWPSLLELEEMVRGKLGMALRLQQAATSKSDGLDGYISMS